MIKKNKQFSFLLTLFILSALSFDSAAQTVSIGSGSYTTRFPGVDQAGRNGFPSGTPQLSGTAVANPVPTNDWWSKLVKEDHADNLFNYPMTLKTTNNGLIVTYIPWGVIGDSAPILVGLSGLNASKTTVFDYSDWTVMMDWSDGTHGLQATSGIGMPFLYFEKGDADEVAISVNSGTVTIDAEMLIIENATHGADFSVYAPIGSTWIKNGTTYSSTLNGKNYWSLAMLPQDVNNINAVADSYKKYAYVFPTNTQVDWSYNKNNGLVKTEFTVTTEVKEGTNNNILQGILPHQWSNLSPDSPIPNEYSYSSVRGEMKTLNGNTFAVENTFRGILPTMPYLANYSEGFSPTALSSKISQIKNDGLSDWTDSYNEGQVMNRLIQTARIADQTGDVEARDKIVSTIKNRLEDWLTYQSGEVAFLFYYNNAWSSLLGYPAGHGQDNNINDHHFHWGYFIHAAAFMEQFQPGWADDWGEFINLLIRDAASPDRNDEKFPFLRNFSPYAGHSWANGFATFPQGNDQESTSESMQFSSSLIHWGSITGNEEILDLGTYLYTTEQSAIEEYWLDIHERNFRTEQQYALVSRVWGNSYDNGTFWTSDITASYGIELYPIHGGSLYLGHNIDYVQKIWNELQENTAILSSSDDNPNLWHDTFWKYLSFLDPQKAIELYDVYPNRMLKFGISDAQTYHWIHAMNAMGKLKATITANHPIAAVFEKDGDDTYVAHNYSDEDIVVTFSDGYMLSVPANKMATSRDVFVSGTMTSNFDKAYANGSVALSVSVVGEGVTKVSFYDGNTLLGEEINAPYQMKATNLSLGKHGMYAKVYVGEQFNVTNTITIVVGEQMPYLGTRINIPGIIEAGHYDQFEGGNGQDIAYVDTDQNNQGDFRPNESVDAAVVDGEGATIGWIGAGEWVEYSIDVERAGYYDVAFRYASGNSNGGGPFYFEVNGERVSSDISVNTTSTSNWETFVSKTVNDIPLNAGKQILRIVFKNGEFNLGKMTFTFDRVLENELPFAVAGENIKVITPVSTAQLDGNNSTGDPAKTLIYTWEQLYGPSTIQFSNKMVASPSISSLEEGLYKCKLSVGYDSYTSTDEVFIVVSETGNIAPVITITAPNNNTSFKQGEEITFMTQATDLDGNISKVEFFDGTTYIGEATETPYNFVWNNPAVASYEISAKAIDDEGAESISEVLNISVVETKVCSQVSSDTQQGSFSAGYKVTFETLGTNVTITFQLLDTDKAGVVAYLWKQDPFQESQMDHISGTTFSRTIAGAALGTTIRYACKFAYAGGLSATKYFSYVVGTSCTLPDEDGDGIDDDIDECPNTLPNKAVNEKGCDLSLDNFIIQTTNETCVDENDATIIITTQEDNSSYVASFDNKTYSFNGQNLKIENIAPGNYSLCLSVTATDYEQCHAITIEEASPLVVASTAMSNAATIEVIKGTPPFDVLVNNQEVLTTEDRSFVVAVDNGDLLEIKTRVLCEGTFSKVIDFDAATQVGLYSNPTKGSIKILLPNREENTLIEIYSISSQLISSETYIPIGGIVMLSLKNKIPGVYFIKIYLDKPMLLKAIKL